MIRTIGRVPVVLLAVAIAGVPGALGQPSPYAGFEQRSIKALSAEEVEGYLSGQGMGLAMPAELNGYPGPKHVLDLADGLSLTAKQREDVQAIFDRMHHAAVEAGKEYVDLERRLDSLFSGGAVDPDTLTAVLDEIGGAQSRLRFAHLRAHLETKPLLSPEQIARYAELRGYAPSGAGTGHEHHGHGQHGHGH